MDLVVRAVADLVAPDRLAFALLDPGTNRLVVAYEDGLQPVRTDDPLIQLALSRGPLVFSRRVAREARRLDIELGPAAPASWLGVPVVAAGRGRRIGALSLGANRAGVLRQPELMLVSAIAAQAAIALENARLVELLSGGKREWELTVDAITQAICIIDSQGVVRRANQAFASLIQQPVTSLAGRPWLGLLPPEWTEVVARALAQPGSPSQELRAGERILLVSAVPMAGTDIGAAVLMFEDQTDKRRLQEQLIQSEKMSAIGQLIAGVAHDLNNPLASVVGFSDFLWEAGEIPPALAEPLQVIRQEAERAATIVKNLLSFARRQQEQRELQSIGRMLESTLALLRNELMAKKVEATLEVEPDVPPVEVNGNQIKQVFVNLINNAAQAMAGSGRGGRIWVTARRWLDGVAVSVADDGPGIPDEIAARVFEPFFTTKGRGKGTGLGLSTVYGIVKQSGGYIWVASAPGQGTTFNIYLPPVDEVVETSEPHPEQQGAPQGCETILLVEDEDAVRALAVRTLEKNGYCVLAASNGREALDVAERHAGQIDLLVTDVVMPHMGGTELVERLATERPEMRVLYMSGYTDGALFHDGELDPETSFLQKPFAPAGLARKVRAVLSERQERAEHVLATSC